MIWLPPSFQSGQAPKGALRSWSAAAVCPSAVVQLLWNTTPPPVAAVTVIALAPLLPSLVAVMVTLPGAIPATKPLDTDATPGALDAQVINRPDSGAPFTSSSVAVSRTVCPTAMLPVPGLRPTAP